MKQPTLLCFVACNGEMPCSNGSRRTVCIRSINCGPDTSVNVTVANAEHVMLCCISKYLTVTRFHTNIGQRCMRTFLYHI